MHRVERRVGQQQRVGIGQADVFRRADHEAAGDKLRLLAALNHTRQPVERGVGVAAAYAFDESRDNVVVHLALLVVGGGRGRGGQQRGDQFVGHRELYRVRVGRGYEVEQAEQFARVAAAVAQQRFVLLNLYVAVFEIFVLRECAVEQGEEIVLAEWLEHVDLHAREERADHLERGVLRGGADERHHARLHGIEQRVLLRFREAVDFVDEEQRALRGEEFALGGAVERFAHLLHTGGGGGEREERHVEAACYDVGKCGFTHARRSPEYK